MARIKARILTATPIDGAHYKADQVVVFEEKHAKALEATGAIDTSPAAVKYCVDELKAKVVEHAPKEDPAPAPAAKAAGKPAPKPAAKPKK